jgi:hypothetical protein
MAFGFRECCNEFSYFTVTGIPASVSEFEVYYIRTLEGLNFCATYTQLPTLNYQAPNYILLELTQQTDCNTCIELYPCPAEDIILVNQFTAGSVQIDTDCQVNTLQPMIAQCQSVNPTFSNTPDGSVALFVVGGTPPYTFISAGTQDILSVIQTEDIYLLYQNVSAGTYSITTIDSTGDFSITRNCVLSGPPPIPVAVPIVTPASFFNAPDGSIDLNITGGIGPYTVIYEGETIELPLTGLLAGTYYFQVIDAEEYLIEVEAVVTQPDYPDYPTNLCATFTFCGTEFRMSFQLTSEFYNYRPVYNCINPSVFGMTELKLRYELNFGGSAGWVTTNELVQVEDIQFDSPPGNCNLLNNTFRLQRTGLGPLALPQGSFFGLGIIISTIVPVTVGGCPPSIRILNTVGACPGQKGKIIYEGRGGSGPQYTFFYSSDGTNYTQTLATQLDLDVGTYSIKVRDSIGTESSVVSFTISTLTNTTFNNSSITKCSIVNSATLSGTLDGPVQAGGFRQFNSEVTYYYDFSSLPDGVTIGCDFNINVNNIVEITDAELYYDIPRHVEFEIKVLEFLIINENGNINDLTNTFVGAPSCPSSTTGAIAGGTTVGGVNYGNFCTFGLRTDGCEGPAGQVIFRDSPNRFNTCTSTENFASFIEDDLSGKKFFNNYNIKSEGVQITNQTKIIFKLKFRVRNSMSVYYPTILYGTDASTISNPYVPQITLNALNQTNTIPLAAVGGYIQLRATIGLQKITISQPPSSCVTLPPGSLINTISNVGGQTTGLAFEMNNSYSTTQPADNFINKFAQREQSRLNFNFLPQNNSCAGPPSWTP